MDIEELLEDIIRYTLISQNQELWDILYPFLIDEGFQCEKKVYDNMEILDKLCEPK